jgi:SSS family solute:Na+ symporter
MSVSFLASLLLDGRQKEYSPYTVVGQRKVFRDSGRAEKEQGWFVVPGRIDRASYFLLGFFAVSILFLYLFNRLL